MTIIARDAADRAQQLLALCERLTAMVQAECAAVKARRLPADGPDAEEKSRLTTLYRQEMMRLKADPSLLAGLAPGAKERLRAAALRLEEAATTLAQEVAALKEISEGLVQAVAEAVQAVRRGPATYTQAGGYAKPKTSAGPLTVNRSA
jgi:predicted component of type VI protein secretion system